LQGTYRVDLWGEQKSLVEAADMQVLRARYEHENVRRNLIHNLVASYVSYLVVEDGQVLAVQNQQASESIVQSVEQRLALGDATRDEVEQQRATLAMLQTATPALENQLDNIRTSISRLVGALPGTLQIAARGLDELSVPDIPSGVPASLIFTRPDIKVMEARMRAAHANIELARARLMPPIDLVVQSGFSGLALSELLLPQSFFWASAASLTATVFDGGRRQGERDYADAYYEEMTETYRQTVFQAIREVESAISTVNTTQRRLDAQIRSSRAALGIFKTASDAFALQAVDSMAVLEARKNYQRSLEEVLKLKAELLVAHAQLQQALGGAKEPFGSE
jgi:NodT family efflux transporter outer membrane factor (OMF) lipoprotein